MTTPTTTDIRTGRRWAVSAQTDPVHDLDGRPQGLVAEGTIHRPTHRSNNRPLAGTREHTWSVALADSRTGDHRVGQPAAVDVDVILTVDGQEMRLHGPDLEALVVALCRAEVERQAWNYAGSSSFIRETGMFDGVVSSWRYRERKLAERRAAFQAAGLLDPPASKS